MSAPFAPPSKKVEFYRLDANGNPPGTPTVTAQYNPTQLQYTITNTAARGSGSQRTQRVDESSAKLNIELIFDTTDTGQDVRLKTQEVAVLMEPDQSTKVPPKVDVVWGAFKFRGIFDSYRETIDFFSEDGIPLRATVSLTMSSPAEENRVPPAVFHFAQGGRAAGFSGQAQLGAAVETPARSGPVSRTAQEAGDPSRARDIAAANGVEDIRNPSGETDTLVVPESEPELLEAVAFASGGVGAGFSAGVSAGFSAGVGAGFSAGVGAGFSAGVGAGFSAGVGAGFSAGAGAGAGFSAGAGAGFSAGAGAGFSAGAGAGFSAGAGAGAGFSAGAGAGFSAGAGAGAGFSAGAGAGFSAGAGAGFSAGAGAGFSAGAGAGFSAGAGAGFSAGAGAGFSAGARAGYSAGAGARFSSGAGFADAGGSFSSGPMAGSLASAGVSASQGAFAFLRAPAPPPRRPLDASRLLVRTESTTYAITRQTQYAVGGRVIGEGSASYRAEVGQSGTFSSKITFEED
ncbi:CIS tube protein [Sorangium sp. So ce861]|uniref:CIS tube protein n=1 Tax=Sorangium sp. So ce861 TaxID=3133323 RepID=UPI003F61FB18